MIIPINYSYIYQKPLLSHLKTNLAILGAPGSEKSSWACFEAKDPIPKSSMDEMEPWTKQSL